MAADVSSLVRLLSRYGREDGGGDTGGGVGEGKQRSDLVTRDLLGGCCVVGGGVMPALGPTKELYANFHVPSAGEKRPETMSRDACLQQSRRGGGGIASYGRQFQDLNLPPLWSPAVPLPVRRTVLRMPDLLQQNSAPALGLKLPMAAPPPVEYQSVCTLEKVKSALERAERESRRKQQQHDPPAQPRHTSAASASPTSSSTTTSSAKRRLGKVGLDEEGEGNSGSPPEPVPVSEKREDGAATGGREAGGTAEMAAAGCPGCLLYVLISRSNPRCPRCNSAVPLPPPIQAASKKPRIDLNTSTSLAAASSPIRTVKFF